ncbi:DUF3991 and TOPRIM domain-containing protein [Paenibacillus amylolyticus]|uniref:DUF3991 and TOPRIM domain-containing protein n=1 Tax=Paenibacillus amylolyticus TaxID=1451 RepID=UPI00096C154F|nr:DUF3991 and TOPRIM domain-containing protein [Paenibacillus amylolyticus]OMF45397.1 hypothetical protein BK136_09860 [Paenibacillus amylolyticus]
MGISKTKLQKARQVNLIDFCEFSNIELIRDGGENYKLKDRSSVIIKGNYYKDFSDVDSKGNSVDFCCEVLGMEFVEAVNKLVKFGNGKVVHPASQRLACGTGRDSSSIGGKFEMPQKSNITTQMHHYLKRKRLLNPRLVDELRRKHLIYQDLQRNCVFVCYNLHKSPMGAIIRGTNVKSSFKGRAKNSDVNYGWVVEPALLSHIVIITENPIDSISIMDLFPTSKKHYHLSLGGVHIGAVLKFLQQYPHVEKLVLALDKDEAGNRACVQIEHDFKDKEIERFQSKFGKDWNEELVKKKEEKKRKNR